MNEKKIDLDRFITVANYAKRIGKTREYTYTLINERDDIKTEKIDGVLFVDVSKTRFWG